MSYKFFGGFSEEVTDKKDQSDKAVEDNSIVQSGVCHTVWIAIRTPDFESFACGQRTVRAVQLKAKTIR